MATSGLSSLDGWCTSQLQIVLLGGRNSGKNSVGNLILGKEEFVTKERTSCSRRLGLVAGRWITVVDTPGWWCDFSAQDTSELVKREILSSVSLCSPGPHVLLVTVKASSAFSERRRRAVEEHVALLGENVWSHCIVVFTSADGFEHCGAEKCLERGGKALRWLSDKCSQRCHSVVLSDGAEVKELLVKIQNLVTENGNRVFEMQENILRVTAEEKRLVKERAQLRFIRMKKQRSLMRARLKPVTDIRIVLLGAKGSGKTSALNTILGRESIQQTSRTAQCVVGKGVVFGRQVTLVDTPGWWMNYFCAESAVFDQREMVLGLSQCPPGPHVFLLVIRVDRAFTETYRRSAQEHLELISEHIWSRVLLLFSFGDWLGGTTTEQFIESEGEPLRWLVERCNNRYHVLNSKTKGDGFQVRELIGKLEEMMMSGYSSRWHYEIERSVLEQLEGRMKQEKDRAKERLMRRKTQRQMAKSQLEKLNPLPEMRIVLIGGRKTGKSSCGNTILNQKSFDTDVQTTSCAEKLGEIGGKLVSVLDTPGCFSVTSDVLTASCAILLVINVSSSFKDAHREALEEQLEAEGGRLWRRTMVLFSYGDWLGDTSIEQRIESEGESLRGLVEKCGNRYHVVDNKCWGDGAQAKELMELVEETLVGERMDVLQRGDHMCKSVSSAQDAMTLSKKGVKGLITGRHELFSDLPESTSTPNCAAAAAQIVALPAHRARRRTGFTVVDMSYIGSVLSGAQRLRWSTGNIPVWLSATHLRLNGLMHPRNKTMLLVSSQNHHTTLAEEDTVNVHSLCQPVRKDRTLRRLSESGDVQMLIDQWGSSSLEELEAFIDSYFKMVWEETMGSCQDAEPDCPPPELDAVIREAAEKEKVKEVLSSIDRKLSKLELLEEIRGELVELKQSLESSWRAIQELGDKNKRDQDDTC